MGESRQESTQLNPASTEDIHICPVSKEPCPLDINLDLLGRQLGSPEGQAAVESMKKLVAVKRGLNDCRDGEHTTVENLEPTRHCDLNDVASVIRGARQISEAFGLEEAIIEATALNKVSEHKKLEWQYGKKV